MARDSRSKGVPRRAVLRTGAGLAGLGVVGEASGSQAETPPQQATELDCGATVTGKLTVEEATSFRGPDGTVLAADDDSAGDLGALLRRRLSTGGEYTIVATSFGAQETFPYRLAVGCNDRPQLFPESQPIECDSVLTDELVAGDELGFRSPRHFHDSYVFSGTAGTTVTLSMVSTTGDAYLYLLDDNSTIIAEDDDGGSLLDALIPEKLQSGGEYTVVATSSGAGETFVYDLTLQCR